MVLLQPGRILEPIAEIVVGSSTSFDLDSLETAEDPAELLDDEDVAVEERRQQTDELEDDGKSAEDCMLKTDNSRGGTRTSKTQQVEHLQLDALCGLESSGGGNGGGVGWGGNNAGGGDCYVDEIVLPAESLQSLSELKSLTLRSNGIQTFPLSILQLITLTKLDLSCNSLSELPEQFVQLQSLRELVLDFNQFECLPDILWRLQYLCILSVAHNRLVKMRALILAEAELKSESHTSASAKDSTLSSLNLQDNHLKGNIVLGNYGIDFQNLTQLDVSHNRIEHLDLSAIEQLQVLQCSKNMLTHLTIHGRNITTLVASHNALTSINTIQSPTTLTLLDLAHNRFTVLPTWLCSCNGLESVQMAHNKLNSLPEQMFNLAALRLINVSFNQLECIPHIQRLYALQQFFAHENLISAIPAAFFQADHRQPHQPLHNHCSPLTILNLSKNRICDTPQASGELQLQKLYLTANHLHDTGLDKIAAHLPAIKVLHLAYNNLTRLPEQCANYWPNIEELVVSGNRLRELPAHISAMTALRTLRAHSNVLHKVPKQLCELRHLSTLDLAHNQLDRIDLSALIAPGLRCLDLSCNHKLHVDSHQFNTYRTQRKMSLVDVSGKNRTSLPVSPLPYCEIDLTEANWSIGFAESADADGHGCQYVRQVRLPAFCNSEGLFAMFDGRTTRSRPAGLEKLVPRLILEQRTVKETMHDYLRFTMLAVQRELRENHCANAVICHVTKPKTTQLGYTLRVASMGEQNVVLGKASGSFRIFPTIMEAQTRRHDANKNRPCDPLVAEFQITDEEYLVMANDNLWMSMSAQEAVSEVCLQRNPILGAKRLQDVAQSFGMDGNLSVLIVKFHPPSSPPPPPPQPKTSQHDLDGSLMRELRRTVRKCSSNKSTTTTQQSSINDLSTCCCCCSSDQLCPHDDRSSASGVSESGHSSSFVRPSKSGSGRSVTPSLFESGIRLGGTDQRRSYRGGVARAVVRHRKDDDSKNDTDSGLSEEQFKCWEYMLEQNTQLLFDKELNTLSKAATKKANATASRGLFPFRNGLSRSNPQITTSEAYAQQAFLSKQFGSSRSFGNPLANPLSVKAAPANVEEAPPPKLMGGPHAAYFGSLQRLMPYNLEYDLAVMHERGLADSLDLDRMHQYWGVTTTEL